MSQCDGIARTYARPFPTTRRRAFCASERSEPLSDSVSAGCRRLLGAMSLLHRQIVGRNFLCCHTGRCEDQTLRERGKNKIRQKSAISAVALSWRHRAAFWGNAANVLFAPSPSRVFPRAPFPLNPHPLSPFFLWLCGNCPAFDYTRSYWWGAPCRFVA